jgi:hypothetical protein
MQGEFLGSSRRFSKNRHSMTRSMRPPEIMQQTRGKCPYRLFRRLYLQILGSKTQSLKPLKPRTLIGQFHPPPTPTKYFHFIPSLPCKCFR